jgi:hypothetical protein
MDAELNANHPRGRTRMDAELNANHPPRPHANGGGTLRDHPRNWFLVPWFLEA